MSKKPIPPYALRREFEKRALRAEKRYGRFGAHYYGEGFPTVGKIRPAKGTLSLIPGIYRSVDKERRWLDAVASLSRRPVFAPKPRLVKK